MRGHRSAWVWCLGAAIAAAPAGDASWGGVSQAAELRLGTEPYAYTVLEQDLRVLLREFGSNVGVRVSMTDAVQGRVRGQLSPLPPAEFLDRLSRLYGFDWYFDGYLLYISATAEGASKVLALGGVTFQELAGSLDRLGISDPRFVLRQQGAGDFILAAGPPRFIELVEQTVGALQARRADPPAARAPVAPGAPAPAEPARAPQGMLIYRGADVKRVQPGAE